MKSATLLKASAALLLSGQLAGCAHTNIVNDVPDCAALIPAMLLEPVPPVDLPEPRSYSDGHEMAQPWQEAFVGQTGQLDKANERAPAVNHIYSTCLRLHREALARSQRGFFARLFGG